MSQQDIIDTLEEINEASAEELANLLNLSMNSIRKALIRMFKAGEVERLELKKKEVKSKGIKYSGRHYYWKLK